MFKKLQSLYPHSILLKENPINFSVHYYWFSNDNEWIGIPKKDLSEEHLSLLRTLFDFKNNQKVLPTSTLAAKWQKYLLNTGPLPCTDLDANFRIIFFQLPNISISLTDFEIAIKGFFEVDIIIVWETEATGFLIEPKSNHFLNESDFTAMIETIRADFFVETYLYIGKFRFLSESFVFYFNTEKEFFNEAISRFKKEKLFFFEKIVPLQLVTHLQASTKKMIYESIVPTFNDDNELYTTIKNFLELNMNASITSKKLFIHRNTLQYRLDKFTEKTGIVLKDFHSAMTVYMACVVHELED